MYCDPVLIACLKSSQFIKCNTSTGTDVQKSSIWCQGSISGNGEEVEISTVSITQCPVHSDIHSSTDIFREANTGEDGDRGWTYINEWLFHAKEPIAGLSSIWNENKLIKSSLVQYQTFI